MNSNISTVVSRVLIFALAIVTFASTVPAQKIRSDGTSGGMTILRYLEGGGIVVDGNPSCADLNASDDPAFAHITEDWGLKLDFSPPSGMSGPYPYTSGNGRVLTGGAPAEPENSVAINRDGNTFDFSSTRPVTAVIVKGGPDGNVYVYPLEALADQDLTTPGDGQFGISHIEFCYQLTGGATAAPVELGGRVTTSAGRAIANAEVVLTDLSTGVTRMTRTNSFGYYIFDNVEATAFHSLTVSSKRYMFRDSTRYFTLTDSSFEMNFVSSN